MGALRDKGYLILGVGMDERVFMCFTVFVVQIISVGLMYIFEAGSNQRGSVPFPFRSDTGTLVIRLLRNLYCAS